MSWLSQLMHPGKAYDKSQETLNNYYNQGQEYLQPYNQHGQEAYGNYSDAMQKLLNPAALQDEWMKNYHESEMAKNAENMAKEHGLDAASSMGLMGSSPALNAIQTGTTQIGLEDKQKYLDDLMQKYLAGAGMAGNIYNTGASTASNMSQNANNMGQNSAQLTYGSNSAGGDMLSKLLQGGISMATPFAMASGMKAMGIPSTWSLSGGR